MPLIGVVTPNLSYKDWAISLGGNEVRVGEFLGDVLNFIIVALALWLFIIKVLGWVMRNKKAEAAAPPPLTKDQELLIEIRDLLAKQQSPATGA